MIDTEPSLAATLAGRRPQFVGLVTLTRPPLRAKDPRTHAPNPFRAAGVEKLALRIGMLGADYARCVIRQRYREWRMANGECDPSAIRNSPFAIFKSAPLWGGSGRHVDRFFVTHEALGGRYLKFLPTPDARGWPRLPQVVYRDAVTKRPIRWYRIRPFLFRPTVSRRQQTARPVHWRTIRAENVVQLRMGGAIYDFA